MLTKYLLRNGYIVLKTCRECGNLFVPNNPSLQICGEECKCKIKTRKQREYYHQKHQGKPPRIDGLTQHTYRNGYVVLVSCIECQELFVPKHRNDKICSLECKKIRKNNCECNRYKSKAERMKAKYNLKVPSILGSKAKYRRGKDWAIKLNPQLSADEKLERLGTYDTANAFNLYHLSKKKDGTPDFDRERMIVDKLKSKAFDNRKHNKVFVITSGDVMRGDDKRLQRRKEQTIGN